MRSCRLYGGPFDGDTGDIDPPLPMTLWVYECPNPQCNATNGLHWADSPAEAEGRAEEYKIGPETALEQLYVWADLELDPHSAAIERELVPA